MLLNKLLTKNFQRVPLFWVDFNMKKFKQSDAKGSCMCHRHPILANDEHIKTVLDDLCDYIRENYDMEDVI